MVRNRGLQVADWRYCGAIQWLQRHCWRHCWRNWRHCGAMAPLAPLWRHRQPCPNVRLGTMPGSRTRQIGPDVQFTQWARISGSQHAWITDSTQCQYDRLPGLPAIPGVPNNRVPTDAPRAQISGGHSHRDREGCPDVRLARTRVLPGHPGCRFGEWLTPELHRLHR